MLTTEVVIDMLEGSIGTRLLELHSGKRLSQLPRVAKVDEVPLSQLVQVGDRSE